MARKAKEGTIDLYYLNSNNKKEEKKTRAKKASPSRNKNGKNKTKKEDLNDDIFNFDNEIVIGINVLPDPKKEQQKNGNKKKKTTKKNSAKNTKQNSKEIKKNNKSKENNNVRKRENGQVNARTRKKDSKQINEDKHRKNHKKAKLILRIFIIIALFIAVAIFLMTSPMFNITKINISGNLNVSEEQIISLSKIQLDTNTYKMNNAKVEQNIKENAYIDSVVVKRKLPNQINIEVSERKPQYMLKYGNAYVYISSQGYMLEISEERLETAVISGYTTSEENIKPGNRLNQEDLKKLEVVLKIMESASNNDVAPDITEINIADVNNYTLKLEGKGKIAYLGDGTSINDKMIVLKQMIIKAEGKSGEAFLMDKNKMYFREE